VLFDSQYRDKTVSVDLRNETFQNSLDRLTFVNRLFYKILDPSTIIIVDESAAKRRTYDERVLRTFYLENAETKDVETLIKTGIGSQTLTVVSNATLGAMTVFGRPTRSRWRSGWSSCTTRRAGRCWSSWRSSRSTATS
jgi:general secretion pathway protein D